MPFFCWLGLHRWRDIEGNDYRQVCHRCGKHRSWWARIGWVEE